MRIVLIAALILPFTVQALMAAPGSGGAPKVIKIKEEIVNKCGNFPYAPTMAMDAKTATLDDMKKARSAVDKYTAEVTGYQKCLLSIQNTYGEKLTSNDTDVLLFAFNRAEEERDVLATDFNKLVDDYNAANGIVPKPATPAKTVKPAKPATNP